LASFLVTLAVVGASVAQNDAQTVQLRVLLPQENAKVFIDDKLTTQKDSEERLYLSPPLQPGALYRYKVTAKFWPNNYTEVIRTRVVPVKAGQTVTIDLRHEDPKQLDDYKIRFVPTPEDVVEAMCEIAKVGKDDVVYDLGCGDGRIVITAITDHKAKRGVGVDIDPRLVELSKKWAAEAKVSDKVSFRVQDVLTIKDLSEASVVMMYMGEDVNLRLMPILKSTLKPGSRVVSHDFKMGDWKPDATKVVQDEFGDDHFVYLWVIKKGAKGPPLEPKYLTEVIPLRTLDKVKFTETLRGIFPGGPRLAPTFEPDPKRNAIIARGTAEQLNEVRAVIDVYDEIKKDADSNEKPSIRPYKIPDIDWDKIKWGPKKEPPAPAPVPNVRIVPLEDGHAKAIAESVQSSCKFENQRKGLFRCDHSLAP
jgi:uncharacterized protein (TIGR03000 family)